MEIHNLSEYVDKISKLNEECSKKLCLQELLFRGHSDIRYKLLPSIARGRNTSCDITIFNGERNLIELAKNRFPDVFREEMNDTMKELLK